MIAVSGAAMAVIRGRGGGNWGLAGDTVETSQETRGTKCFIAGQRGDGGLIRQFLHRGTVQVARSHRDNTLLMLYWGPAQATC